MGNSTIGSFARALVFVSCAAVFGCSGKGKEDGGGPGTGGDGDGDGDRGEQTLCEDNDDCSDEVFCNGEERCNPDHEDADAFGCIEAAEEPCSEGNSCSEEDESCGCEDPDADGDGHDSERCGGDDCDDDDSNRYPGNEETCDPDHHDEDCDPTTFGFRDRDGDGDPDDQCCNEDESGDLICGTDCNDNNGNQHSFNTEVCDDIDNDCDGLVDETIDGEEDDGLKTIFTIDEDGDGWGSDADDADTVFACEAPEGYVESATDCDDDDNQRSPSATEVCDDVDNDCDGLIDETIDGDEDDGLKTLFTIDADGDGFGSDADDAETVLACSAPPGYVMSATDCDDDAAGVNPGAFDSCTDDIDNDCSGEVNDPIGGCDCTGNISQSCAVPGSEGGPGLVGLCATSSRTCVNGEWDDCGIMPNSQSEVCDATGVDEDCDGKVNEITGLLDPLTQEEIDDSMKETYYRDRDGDDYPDLSTSAQYCPDLEPNGWITDENPHDCVDVALGTDPESHLIHPGAPERCNNRDDDCDLFIDELPLSGAPPSSGATLTCVEGGWDIVDTSDCPSGFAHCDSNLANGCETDRTTLTDCGACDNECAFSCGDDACDEVVGVAAGLSHTCAYTDQGRVACWGTNAMKQAQDSSSPVVTEPAFFGALSGVTELSLGEAFSCAVSDGDIFCWGDNQYAQLGPNGGGVATFTGTPVQVTTTTNITSLAAGAYHVCAVVGGTAKCWGYLGDGRLGRGVSASQGSSVVGDVQRASDSQSLTGVAQVAAGNSHSCARTTGGAVYCWGDDSLGQVGDGANTADKTRAVDVGLSNIVDIAAGSYHSCAVHQNGSVYCWGYNFDGQAGAAIESPYFLAAPTVVSGIAGAARIKLGGTHTCARASANAVWCWGSNASGERGDANGAAGPTPVIVSALAASTMDAGESGYNCALATDMQLQCWGENSSYQLGTGDITGGNQRRNVLSIP